ncbi:MAG TPA: energy transducer TonB [Polyangiaceae bacterium]|nr:energy transducer TonB [Polyangiaceae bacterium]
MATNAMPHFTIAIGMAPDAYGSVSATALTLPAADVRDAPPISEAFVDTRARRLEGRAPIYPDHARAGGIEGDVRLELVVGPEGQVETARVIQSANASLEKAALEAVRSFRFDPAKKSGHRVRVRMRWSIEFRLQ